MSDVLELHPGRLDLAALRDAWAAPVRLVLARDARAALETSARAVRNLLDSGRVVYGVNTGFGLLANTRISADKLDELQTKLVLSHCCGVGEALEPHVVRLVIALKVASLARGHSGVRPAVADALLALNEHDIRPIIPAQGSVGASGDLAPLAHLAAALIGVGHVEFQGQIMPADEAWRAIGRAPLALGPKEGLALLNGTQVSTALALDALFRAERVFSAALCAGLLGVDALRASRVPFDARIHEARGHTGQIEVARRARALLGDSEIRRSHEDCDKVQDPYSLRCQPQVMGACLDLLRQAGRTLRIEANAVTDNPLIFPDDGVALSGGNFHAEPVAFAADMITNASCEIGALSERRTAILVDPKMSGLPAFLVRESGLNSGFMIAQVTAAALVSENRTLAHPASVDSIPTSANQEDHVSMATFGARRSVFIADNAARVAGIELLAAAQALEFHRPLKTSPALEDVWSRVRSVVAPWTEDRFFAADLEAITDRVRAGAFIDLTPNLLSPEDEP
jgi:histidine ammonia-lyase